MFLGVPRNKFINFEYLRGFNVAIVDDGTFQLTHTVTKESRYRILLLNSEGTLVQTIWDSGKELGVETIQDSDCYIYGFCGEFGRCDPKNSNEWNRQNWMSGSVRRTKLQCELVKNSSEASKGDGFFKM